MTDKFIPLESDYRRRGFRWIAGVDEAGRGPLAGPVVAAVCLIPPAVELSGIRDSKQLTEKSREKLFWEIIKRSVVSVGVVDEREIDRINILQASLLAMKQAVMGLPRTPDILFIDGNFPIDLPIEQKPVVGGDRKLISVGAASIVAKVTRDAIMKEMDHVYPDYGFKKHKGYPTPDHLELLQRLGPCPVHRTSFQPVQLASQSKP